MEDRTLSFSSISRYGFTYKNKLYGCPYSYLLKYHSGIEPTTVDAKYGNFGVVIHNVLNEFYPSAVFGNIRNFQSAKAYFYSLLESILQRLWDYSLSDAQYKDALGILNLFADNEAVRYERFNAGVILNFNPMHRELTITEPYNIRIDKVLYPDHMLMDYKTTKNLPANLNPQSMDEIDVKYVLQAGLYALTYYSKYGIWPPKMIYYFVRFNKSLPVQITQEVVNWSTYLANQVTEGINSRRFPKNSDNCGYCDYRHVCGLDQIEMIY